MAEKLDAWPRCWVPYAEVAAAVAAAAGGAGGRGIRAEASPTDARSAIATLAVYLAETHGAKLLVVRGARALGILSEYQ